MPRGCAGARPAFLLVLAGQVSDSILVRRLRAKLPLAGDAFTAAVAMISFVLRLTAKRCYLVKRAARGIVDPFV